MRAEGRSLFLALGLLVAGLCSSVHCLSEGKLDLEDVARHDQHRRLPLPSHAVVSSNTDFAFSLYKQLVLKDRHSNVVFSPLSISMALAFLSLGARGTTLTELLEGLKFNLTETPEAEIHRGFQHILRVLNRPSNLLQLSVGNAMFLDEHLKLLDKFRNDAQELYASEAFSIDFQDLDAALRLINEYVKNKTQGKIVDLFKQLHKPTVLVLVNCIYFKGGCPVWIQKEAPVQFCNFRPTSVLPQPMCPQGKRYRGGCARLRGAWAPRLCPKHRVCLFRVFPSDSFYCRT
uniref:Serpin domain-containing protein n=1 Tax=Catagonus wagneri TaxID=51154 RepID=A0A8C3WXN9_9CETA